MYIVNMGPWERTLTQGWRQLPSSRREKASQTFPFAYFTYTMFFYLIFHSRKLSSYSGSDVARKFIFKQSHQNI